MNDVRALRRTIRRCTAVLVVAVALHLEAVAEGGNTWPVVLFALAALYLVASGFYGFVLDVHPAAAGPDGRSTAESDAADGE